MRRRRRHKTTPQEETLYKQREKQESKIIDTRNKGRVNSDWRRGLFVFVAWRMDRSIDKQEMIQKVGIQGRKRRGGSSAEENRVVGSYGPRTKGLGYRNGGYDACSGGNCLDLSLFLVLSLSNVSQGSLFSSAVLLGPTLIEEITQSQL